MAEQCHKGTVPAVQQETDLGTQSAPETDAPSIAPAAGASAKAGRMPEAQKQRSYDQGFCTAAGAMSVAPSAAKGHLRQLFNDADRV